MAQMLLQQKTTFNSTVDLPRANLFHALLTNMRNITLRLYHNKSESTDSKKKNEHYQTSGSSTKPFSEATLQSHPFIHMHIYNLPKCVVLLQRLAQL